MAVNLPRGGEWRWVSIAVLYGARNTTWPRRLMDLRDLAADGGENRRFNGDFMRRFNGDMI